MKIEGRAASRAESAVAETESVAPTADAYSRGAEVAPRPSYLSPGDECHCPECASETELAVRVAQNGGRLV